MGAPKGMWECTKCGDYNPDYARECGHCHASKDGTSTGYSRPKASISMPKSTANAKRNVFSAQGHTGESGAAAFLDIICWIIWIGGGIASVVMSLVPNRYGEVTLNFGMFLLFAVLFFVAGLTYKFMAELFQNIATIAASVKDMTITQTEQHEDENLTKLANNVAYIADVLRDMKAQQAENPQKNDAE